MGSVAFSAGFRLYRATCDFGWDGGTSTLGMWKGNSDIVSCGGKGTARGRILGWDVVCR